MLPQSRPQIKADKLKKIIDAAGLDLSKDPVAIIGIRGYYLDTMGAPGKNDRGIYDDAIILATRDGFTTFNGNTDPSVQYKTGRAVLKPGLYRSHRFDTHRGAQSQYPAICQRVAPVTVIRDGQGEDTGMFGINIHKGGTSTTSSEGCQTIPPSQWDAFYQQAKQAAQEAFGLDGWNKATIPYLLIENTGQL
jgi:hypothetical protein